MDERALAVAKVRELAQGGEATVTRFYGVRIPYPLSVAMGTLDIVRFGLLPWARSGIRKTVIVRYPQITSAELAHEMSHFALRHICGGRPVPLWFDEGLACFLGDASLCSGEPELRRALLDAGAPDITAWAGTTGKFAWLFRMYVTRQAPLIYGLSLYMVKRLAEVHGVATLQNLVGMLRTADFDTAFVKTYGFSAGDYYRREVIPALTAG